MAEMSLTATEVLETTKKFNEDLNRQFQDLFDKCAQDVLIKILPPYLKTPDVPWLE